jgi:hypothetical protein
MRRHDRLNFDGSDSPRWRLPPAARRVLLAALAIGGTALYAVSFRHSVVGGEWFPLAAAVGIAAGGAWVVLGGLLLVATRGRRATVAACADLCLEVMGLGMIPLLTGAFANVTAFVRGRAVSAAIDANLVLFVHAALLTIAAVLMGAAFASAAPVRLGIARRRAMLLWVLGLNGAFAALLGAAAVAWRFVR